MHEPCGGAVHMTRAGSGIGHHDQCCRTGQQNDRGRQEVVSPLPTCYCPSPLIKAYLESAYSQRSLLTDVADCHLRTLKAAIAFQALAE